jgi:hypothetical protein
MSEKKKPKPLGITIVILAFLIQIYLYFINPLDKNWLQISLVWCLLYSGSALVLSLIPYTQKNRNVWLHLIVFWTIVLGILYFFIL